MDLHLSDNTSRLYFFLLSGLAHLGAGSTVRECRYERHVRARRNAVLGITCLPHGGVAQTGVVLMTLKGLVQIVSSISSCCWRWSSRWAGTWQGSTKANPAVWTVLGPSNAIYRCGSPSQEEMGWRIYRTAMLLFKRPVCRALWTPAGTTPPAPEPRQSRRCRPDLGLQHGRQLRHQHQLAGLRRRDDDELPHADARADGAELRLGRDRHGGAGRADPRASRAGTRRRSAISGSI